MRVTQAGYTKSLNLSSVACSRVTCQCVTGPGISSSTMAVQNGGVRAGEETPLLRGEERSGVRDDGSSGTLTEEQRSIGEDVVDPNKANQHVGKVRGLLIILSLFGLIFLQG